jgi:autotransporter passenger strand-loop-strand repeat protein
MTDITVASGVTSSGLTLSSGEAEYVYGTAVSTTVNDVGTGEVTSGGAQVVYGGGVANATLVDGGIEFVLSGGAASGTRVTGGGMQFVFSGGSAWATTVAGGSEFVFSGGTAVGATVDRGGAVSVGSGGVAGDTTVDGGYETVSSGGVASVTTVEGGGSAWVAGTAISTTVNGGSYMLVSSGGTASFTTVSRDGVAYVQGAAVSTTVNSGGEMSLQGTAQYTAVGSGGREDVYGTEAYATLSGGAEYVFSGSAIGTTVDSGGVEAAYGVQLVLGFEGGSIEGATVNSGGSAVVAGGQADGITVNSGGVEIVSAGGLATDTVLNAGGAIDLADLLYASGGSARVDADGVLTVSVGGQSYAQLLSGDYADARFLLAPDPGGGTLVTLAASGVVVAAEVSAAPCYRAGTRILTARGEVVVEALRVGDLVPTVLGEALVPIVWVGRREVDCARHPHPAKVWPVRVAAGAFGPGRPHSALFLSPDHAVYVEDVLIPIRCLINGSTIAQVRVERVTYCHLELAEHDVVLAEGLPAESFLDMRDGSAYANRPGPVRLYPDFSARMWEAFGCARLVVTGPEVLAARALVARFAVEREAA